MIDIVESQLYLDERTMFSTFLVFFAELKQKKFEDLHYSFDKDNHSIRLYIEEEEGLIEFLYVFDEKYYQLSHYPKKGSRFNELNQDSLEEFMSELLQAKKNNFIFYA